MTFSLPSRRSASLRIRGHAERTAAHTRAPADTIPDRLLRTPQRFGGHIRFRFRIHPTDAKGRPLLFRAFRVGVHCSRTMTKDGKISNFERVLSWLPEPSEAAWATSNPFLSSTLNEVLNQRDTRLSGTPCTSRLKTAVTALLQVQDRRDKSAALILAASREAEETAFTLASRRPRAPASGSPPRRACVTAQAAAIFATAPDLVVTNPKVLKKVFDKGFVAPEAFRTYLAVDAQRHYVMGHGPHRFARRALSRRPPADRDGPRRRCTTEDPYTTSRTPPPTAGRPTRRRVKPPPRNAWYSYPKRR